MADIARVLEAAQRDDPQAATQLLPRVYTELRKLAAAKMARELPGQPLQPTALVHEAWLRGSGPGHTNYQNRARFFAAAAEAMRRILIDNARRKHALQGQPVGAR
ncbi:MAG TPA: ECF-type sigma factor, partial [Verrucomicrobiota bacterium]|nr:ECF-type sigma factor [Verrucomicrobiota bacterium]